METAAVNDDATNASLVGAVLSGQDSAFADLYDRYARLVRAICHDATGNLTDAKDLCQEVFLRAYRKLADLREPEKFPAWLVSIARRVCQEWRRRRARDRHEYVGRDVESWSTGAAPDYDDEDLSRLRDAITDLPDTERLAVHLYYLQEHAAEHARMVLDLSRSGFYRVLDRARRRLRQALADEETKR